MGGRSARPAYFRDNPLDNPLNELIKPSDLMSAAFGFLMSVLRFGQVGCSSRTQWTVPAPL